jgi:hypothetical protein
VQNFRTIDQGVLSGEFLKMASSQKKESEVVLNTVLSSNALERDVNSTGPSMLSCGTPLTKTEQMLDTEKPVRICWECPVKNDSIHLETILLIP